MNLNPIEIIAIVKAIKDKEAKTARGELEVGTHAIDYTARITGLLTVGEDHDYTPTISVPLKSALALFIRYSGITREAAKATLTRAMTEALNESLSTSDTVSATISEDMSIIDDCQSQVAAMMAELPKQRRKGLITSKLEVVKQ